MEKKKYPQSQRKYNLEYQKTQIKNYLIRLNRNVDKDIIEYLNKCDNKQAFIKESIREGIKKSK